VSGGSKYGESDRAGRKGKLAVMRSESQVRHVSAGEQRARQMNGVQRSEKGREWFLCPSEHARFHGNDFEAFELLEDRCSLLGYGIVVQPMSDACSVDRPKTFKTSQLARERTTDPGPLAEHTRFAEDHPEQDRGIDVHRHRVPRSSRNRSVDRTGHRARR
jgi:hypothetical protein